MSTVLFHTPLSAPARLVGSVDATHERTTPCPRTLEQAFGKAAVGGVIVPMDTPAAMPRADRIVTLASAAAGAALLVLLTLERIAPWLFA